VWHRRLSRRQLLAFSGTVFAAKFLTGARAQSEAIRIGVVLPTKTGLTPIRAATHQVAGEAARMGAILAEEEFGLDAERRGKELEVLIATAPNAEAARRAAKRLASVEKVFALVGGFGEDQALALSDVAEEHRILFFNIGSTSDALRDASCRRHTFHVEASATMYLHALTTWLAHAGFRHWFFIYEGTAEGEALYGQALETLEEQHLEARQVGRAAVTEAPSYAEAFKAIRETNPDTVLLFLDPVAQLDFLAQYENVGLDAEVVGFPDPVTQTRTFFAAARAAAPRAGSGYRAMLWEATLDAHGAHELNQRFLARWGLPMDSPAWAAYQAVNMLFEATSVTGTQEGHELASFLESPRAVFNVQKETGVSFRPGDHQLHQSLYLVKISTEAEQLWDLATPVGELPAVHTPDPASPERC
jgi:ABC transporter substrate binding protein (PQQ-dependent alcohol dehydrogenase system)